MKIPTFDFVLNYPKLLKEKLNDLDYEMWNIKIISDAIEFEMDSDVVKAQLEANWKKHYDKHISEAGTSKSLPEGSGKE